MDEAALTAALRAAAARMPGADIDQLTPVVAQTWTTFATGGGDDTQPMRAVVDVAHHRGYRAGVAAGHAFTTSYLRRAAAATYERMAPPVPYAAWRVLDAVRAAAQRVQVAGVRLPDIPAAQHDYRAALGERGAHTPEQRAAVAARVGWTQGRAAGHGDAAWSASVAIIDRAIHLAGGEQALHEVHGADQWLQQLQTGVLAAAAAAQACPPPAGTGQAFPHRPQPGPGRAGPVSSPPGPARPFTNERGFPPRRPR